MNQNLFMADKIVVVGFDFKVENHDRARDGFEGFDADDAVAGAEDFAGDDVLGLDPAGATGGEEGMQVGRAQGLAPALKTDFEDGRVEMAEGSGDDATQAVRGLWAGLKLWRNSCNTVILMFVIALIYQNPKRFRPRHIHTR